MNAADFRDRLCETIDRGDVRVAPFAETSRPSAAASTGVGTLLKTRAAFLRATARVGVA